MSTKQDSLSHNGTFSVVAILPFIKLDNTSENSPPLKNITKFGQPNFLAMATTHSTDNTDDTSLFLDLVVAAAVLNKRPGSNLQLEDKEMKDLLV